MGEEEASGPWVPFAHPGHALEGLVLLFISPGLCRVPASPPSARIDCPQFTSSSTAVSPCPACETSALLSLHFSAILDHVGGVGWLPRQSSLTFYA